ncbi:hypothetical protein DSM19430T_13080 [Desulfovibrio psychrotolerans]|uniref:Uncharacterized protein n=2 Tax=Desulfovibrio psychrotolerans TaxID=415242 RepID=A0A7J0BUE8_9BACT|nr:hypothetical protein DSM19430T_13080 [Desulfovibrio psychrotolerans]
MQRVEKKHSDGLQERAGSVQLAEMYGECLKMNEFLVRCVWPDGDVEFHLCASEREARAWASDARRDGDCKAGVYGLLAVEYPQAAERQPEKEPLRRAVCACGVNGAWERGALQPEMVWERSRAGSMPPPDWLPPAQSARM